ncbi:MAG: MarR family transcriptional regulator [Alphaproteobacteria bacterium]|nr:MarR family transcriptional regulator [Alphaproteobacteria bacterium]
MSSKTKRRQELEAALNARMREVSGQSVLYSQAVADRLGINTTDLECLDYISRGPLNAGRLAELTGLTTGAVTGVIDRLEHAGLARRQQDAGDRRRILVVATPAVAQRVAPLFEPMERNAMSALAMYRDDQLVLLLDFLKSASDAALVAMSELRVRPAPRSTSRRPPKSARRTASRT